MQRISSCKHTELVKGLEKVNYYSNGKNKQYKRMPKVSNIALISYASKIMLYIVYFRLCTTQSCENYLSQ